MGGKSEGRGSTREQEKQRIEGGKKTGWMGKLKEGRNYKRKKGKRERRGHYGKKWKGKYDNAKVRGGKGRKGLFSIHLSINFFIY